MALYRIGIDLGGTKIEVIALSISGECLYRQRVATPQGDYHATLSVIVQLIKTLEQALGGEGRVGIGTPGSPSRQSGLMKNCNSTCLNGKPLQQDLERHLQRSVRLANDANCFALSEAIDGAGKGCGVVFGVILGTGVGGGLVVNQQGVVGLNHIAGEWGHNLLPEPVRANMASRPCYCGRRDCVESYLSGPGLATSYVQLGGEQLAAQTVAERAEQGEPLACSVMALYQQQLAYSLSQLMNIIDPDVIVLGGGLSNIASLYETVPQLWRQSVFNDEVYTELKPAVFGDASGVRGAAWL